ncbi:D-3-phosphoglycerate dehydrogenase [bacterium HR10]|nr:D-3-phosphoglycerate dehydrogenase [bacterium HR10]
MEIALQVRDYLQSGIIRNAVNFPALTPEELQRLGPFLELGEKLGAFIAQIARVRPSEIGIRYYGELNRANVYPISNAVLCGVLRQMLDEEVNLINARLKAEERNIEVIETRSSRARSYANLISVQLRDGAGGVDWVEGTVLHPENLRLVSIDGVNLEIPLTPYMLLIRNEDVPGVIGRVGTVLGNAQVNIGHFALARGGADLMAIGVLTLDSPISDDVLAEIRRLPAIRDVRAILL